MNITEFLEARITEDERVAKQEDEDYADTTLLPTYDSAHQARWHTARVLAECAAKRAIIEQHKPVDYSALGMDSPNACEICGVELRMGDWDYIEGSFPCLTLKALAAVYKDHPDFQEAWAA